MEIAELMEPEEVEALSDSEREDYFRFLRLPPVELRRPANDQTTTTPSLKTRVRIRMQANPRKRGLRPAKPVPDEGLSLRSRGGQPGNRNRLSHGRYSQARTARRAKNRALIRAMRNLTRRIEMMAWSRKALRECAACAALERSPLPALSWPANAGHPGDRIASSLGRKVGELFQ